MLTAEESKKVHDAKNELMGVLRYFMPPTQRTCLADLLRGEEKVGIAESVLRIAGIIKNMPQTYETEDIATADKVFHLHYFRGNVDAWIIEKDKGDGTPDLSQYQAYGKATLYGENIRDAEWGYISIQEYIENGVELDLHFEPRKIGEI